MGQYAYAYQAHAYAYFTIDQWVADFPYVVTCTGNCIMYICVDIHTYMYVCMYVWNIP